MNVGSRMQRRDHGEPLHHVVLVVRDLRLVVVAHAREQVARELEPVERAQELVVRAVERDLDLVREHLGALLDLDDVVDDAPHGVAHRRERAADVQEVVAERRDPLARLLGRLVLDLVLELVDLGVDVVDEIEVALRDVVDEAVRDHPRRVAVA